MTIVKLLKISLFLKLSSLFLLFLCGNASAAYCTSTPSLPYVISLPKLEISRNLAPGENIPGSAKQIIFSGSCPESPEGNNPGDLVIACYYGVGGENSSFPGVYNTNIPGVGVALENERGERIVGGGIGCNTSGTYLAKLDSNRGFNFKVLLHLVKTDEITAGGDITYTQTEFGIGVYGKSGFSSSNNYIAFANTVNVKPITCNIPDNINMNLGNVQLNPKSGLGSGVGSVSDIITKEFQITCDNTANVDARLIANFTEQGDSVVALSDMANSATGLGVQFLINMKPIGNNDWTSITLGQITTVDGVLNVPLQARYYQTDAIINPGVANATAVLQLIYN